MKKLIELIILLLLERDLLLICNIDVYKIKKFVKKHTIKFFIFS